MFQFINFNLLAMGVYLATPNTKKHTLTGNNKELRYVSSEMQGTISYTQAGEKIWKMPS